MKRRELLLCGLASLAVPGTALPSVLPQGKFLLVVYLYVGSLPSKKAIEFADRYAERLRATKPDGIHFLLIPQRAVGTSVDVYSMDGKSWPWDVAVDGWTCDGEGSKKIVDWFDKEFGNGEPLARQFASEEESQDEIVDYCKMILGVPSVVVEEDALKCFVEDMMHKGRRIGVCNMREFVVHCLDVIRLSNGVGFVKGNNDA